MIPQGQQKVNSALHFTWSVCVLTDVQVLGTIFSFIYQTPEYKHNIQQQFPLINNIIQVTLLLFGSQLPNVFTWIFLYTTFHFESCASS